MTRTEPIRTSHPHNLHCIEILPIQGLGESGSRSTPHWSSFLPLSIILYFFFACDCDAVPDLPLDLNAFSVVSNYGWNHTVRFHVRASCLLRSITRPPSQRSILRYASVVEIFYILIRTHSGLVGPRFGPVSKLKSSQHYLTVRYFSAAHVCRFRVMPP